VLRRLLLRVGLALLAVALLALAGAFAIVWGVGGTLVPAGDVTGEPIPAERVAERAARQAEDRSGASLPRDRQILFGDLHVHTTYSADAFVFSLPIIQGEGAHPPADACDFARFCSELDFWSINDHAELLTPRQWKETAASIRQCNEVAGDGDAPDLVAFLGWEWTQMAFLTGAPTHYGHKNVVLKDDAPDRIPARPIGSSDGVPGRRGTLLAGGLAALASLLDAPDVGPYLDFDRWLRELGSLSECPSGVPVRELPPDCIENAASPDVLFRKLDEWGLPSLVIPHGTSWGIHAPPGASLDPQLARGMHDPARQRLFEVYSGHGTSEVYRDVAAVRRASDGALECPEPRAGYEPCCWRAGELVRERCTGMPDCEERVRAARETFVRAGIQRYGVVPGATPEEWLACGQLLDTFLPAYEYRPRMSAQYALAVRGFDDLDDPASPRAFRFGLIGSSDNHKARGGSGYKEMGRKAMGDAWGPRQDVLDALAPEPMPGPGPVPLEQIDPSIGLMPERGASFYYTGGLVAVHAAGRDRDAIWQALQRREAYGTSGPRILLWFDLLDGAGPGAPMGSEVEVEGPPRFAVRAVGAFEQKPGCPASTRERLSPERIERLCLGECYHPGERRRAISRIEVVRIRPQVRPDEPVATLVEDPWRVLSCPPDPGGCSVEFEDETFAGTAREHVYYVRAIQEPTLAVNGDPLRCERDGQGRCVRTRPCYASGPDFDPEDECLATVEERAWSSPIFVRPGGAARPAAVAVHGAMDSPRTSPDRQE
jgi:hypothetical protein